MRELKFRAWDRINKCWIYSQPMPDMGFWKWVSYDSTTPVFQYIGLKDKNGVEVYEGDVVEHGINSSSARGVVIWDEICAGYRIERLDSDRGLSWAAYREQLWFRVIGHIYEHPELLEEVAK